MHSVQFVEQKLREPIDKNRVLKRDGPGGMTVEYLNDGYVAFALNECFGVCGWDASVLNVQIVQSGRVDALGVYVEDPGKGSAWDAVVWATVEIRVYAEKGGQIITRRRSDVGGSVGPRGGGNKPNAKSLGEAVEFAVKSAVTDAFKRAARFFGPKTGLLLRFRDKKEREALQTLLDAEAHAAAEFGATALEAEVVETAALESEAVESISDSVPVSEAVVEGEVVAEDPAQETVEIEVEASVAETQVEEVAETPVEETPVEEAAVEEVTEAPAESPVEEAPVEEAATEAPVEEAAAVEEAADGPVEVPAVFAELPGAAEAVARICALASKTDAVEVADLGAVHVGLVETFGEAAAFALWTFVGVDLSVKPILVSRDQVLAIAQALEEASVSEGGIEAFLSSISVPSSQGETGEPAVPTAPAEESAVEETHGEQVEAAWREWIPAKLGTGNQQNLVRALTEKAETDYLETVLANQLHQTGMRRLRQKEIPPARALEMWRECGFAFDGKSRPTIAQARQFVQLIPD